MAVTSLTQTTLSAALSKLSERVSLTSLTGVEDGDILYVRGKAMKVTDTRATLANPITVSRGVAGTLAKQHPNSSVVRHAPPDSFRAAASHAGKLGLSGDSGDLPEFLIPVQGS